MICGKKQILYAILAFVLGLSSNWIGGKTMKIYDVNKITFYKDISIALFVVGTLALAYGILSIVLRNNPHFCALTQF
jgi:hypothetical protein